MKRCIGCKELYEDSLIECPHCGYSITKRIESYFLKPGQKLLFDRYEIGNVLGQGGFGITYLAWDDISEKKVSIKEYFPSEFSSRNEGSSQLSVYSGNREKGFRDGLNCFMNEAERLAKLNQIDGIIKILECFEENNTAYIVMEYLEGESLEKKLEREEKIEPDKTVHLLMPILESLVNVHKEGIIHRDIAPDNIFVTNDGNAKLLDFGAARQSVVAESMSLTVIIKAGYSPEEQYSTHGRQGEWTDVYSIAATMYRMITGNKPIDAIGRRGSIIDNGIDSLKDIASFGVKLPANIKNAIMHAMTLEIANRTPDMKSFIDELNGNFKVSTSKSSFAMWFSEKKKIVIPTIAVMICLSAIILFGVTYNMDCMPGKLLRRGTSVHVGDVDNKKKIAKTKESTKTKEPDTEKVNMEDMVMPSLVNLPLSDIEEILKVYGIEYIVSEYVENQDIEENIVLYQSIEVNTKISELTSRVVELTVSCKNKQQAEVTGDNNTKKPYTNLGEAKGSDTTAQPALNSSTGNTTVQTGTGTTVDGSTSQIATKQPEKNTNYDYTITDNKVTLIAYKGSATDVNIPSIIEGYPVTTITDTVFKENKNITSVTIPSSITSMDLGAFYMCTSLITANINMTGTISRQCFSECTSLSKVSIGSGVDCIGISAFSSCKAITKLTIPSNVKKIMTWGISGCSELTEISIQEGVKSIEAECFVGCHKLKNLTIPDSVTSLGTNLCVYCESLTNVYIGDGVEEIMIGSFGYCGRLTNVEIGDSVKIIGDNVFIGDGALTIVKLPKSLKSVSGGAFYACDSLKYVDYKGTESDWNLISIAENNLKLTQASRTHNAIY